MDESKTETSSKTVPKTGAQDLGPRQIMLAKFRALVDSKCYAQGPDGKDFARQNICTCSSCGCPAHVMVDVLLESFRGVEAAIEAQAGGRGFIRCQAPHPV